MDKFLFRRRQRINTVIPGSNIFPERILDCWHGFCLEKDVNREDCDMEQEGSEVQTIGVTIWGHRVSPVFDSARNLLVIKLVNGSIAGLSNLEFDPDRPGQFVQLLRAQNIEVVICGAVSEGPAAVLEASGIELIPFIAGDVRQVVESFIRGTPEWSEFIMPGCEKKICCRGKIRRGSELVRHISEWRQNETSNQLQAILPDRRDKNKE
jgi:predicted Fe-Mo cluster-binding NifX family protein